MHPYSKINYSGIKDLNVKNTISWHRKSTLKKKKKNLIKRSLHKTRYQKLKINLIK